MTKATNWRGFGAALAVLALAGCASADPAATVAATGRTLAEKGIAGLDWRRDAAATDAAVARSRELLAAPLDPDAAARVALLRSPALQATLAELGVAQADLAQATRLANPGFEFSAERGGGHEQTTTGLFADVVDWLTQPLRRKLAEAELERVKLEVAAAVIEQVTEAKLAIVELQAAEALVARLAAIEQIDRVAADYARALHAAGNLTELERTHAEAGWAETAGELGEARAEAARRRESVVRALGLSGVEAWSVAPLSAPPAAIDGELAALETLAVAERLDLAAARWAVDALERGRALRRATRWLPVGVELGWERERDIEGETIQGPTIALALPIFDTGKASLARYDAEIARARAQLAALEGEVRSAVREKAGDLAAASELARHYRETVVPLRLRALDLTLREYNQMVVGTFEVLIAKQEQVDAERHHLAAVAAAWTARFELDRAIGRLLGADASGTGGGR
jgi:cobalt-zinc-cadmium efflux system outer membrane protein